MVSEPGGLKFKPRPTDYLIKNSYNLPFAPRLVSFRLSRIDVRGSVII
jgi:hypothetical protein